MSPCYEPLQAWRSRRGTGPSGLVPLVFKQGEGIPGSEMRVPCGRCIGCLKMRATEWAARCMCEAEMHEENAFLTLTYAKIPRSQCQLKTDFVVFMREIRRKYGNNIKYFHCAENGSLNNRPHHHACIFGINIKDKEKLINSNLSISQSVNKIWNKGISTIGEVNYASALYVAKYLVKSAAILAAGGTGGAEQRPPSKFKPYVSMSRRPGIGASWVDRYGSDLERMDALVASKTTIVKVPRYFDKRRFTKMNPELVEEVKKTREREAKKHIKTREYLLKTMNAKLRLESRKKKGQVDNG